MRRVRHPFTNSRPLLFGARENLWSGNGALYNIGVARYAEQSVEESLVSLESILRRQIRVIPSWANDIRLSLSKKLSEHLVFAGGVDMEGGHAFLVSVLRSLPLRFQHSRKISIYYQGQLCYYMA
jgi:hypothetical protein